MQTTDMITFHCPSCSMKLQVPAEMAGVTGPCPQCSAMITAPLPSAEPLAAAPVAATLPTAPVPLQQAQQTPQQPLQQKPVTQNPHQQNVTTEPRENPASRVERPSVKASPVARERVHQHALQPKPRARWMRVVFPLAFLIVAAALVFAVFQAVGVFNVWDLKTSQEELITNQPVHDPDDTPATIENNNPPAPANTAADVFPDVVFPAKDDDKSPAVQVIKDMPEDGEFPELKLPSSPADDTDSGADRVAPAPPVSPTTPPETTTTDPPITPTALPQDNLPTSPPKAGFLANQNLNLFLNAKTLDERMGLMSTSKHTREELLMSCLAGPLKPIKSIRMVEMVPRAEDNMTQYLYFVSFEDPAENQQRQRIVMQVVERPGIHPPRVHADAFIEHYEKKLTQYAKHPNKEVTTFHCIAEARTAELSKDLPEDLKDSMIRFVIKSHPHGPSMFDAYLNKNSPLMENVGMRKDFPYVEPRFCVLSFRWNTTDPKYPYIELNDIVTQGWEE